VEQNPNGFYKIFFDEKDPTGVSYNTPFTVYGSYQGRLWSKTPTGSIKYYTQNSDLSVYATTGSNQFSGSQTVTGSLTVTGGITGTATTASYVEYTGVANKPTLVSGSAQVTYSGLTGVPSGIVSSSAQVGGYGVFATTGSNQFNGSQAVTGSLTVTGQVVAQTLNVQQVTSSIVYSSGSNIFGNSLGNTQQFTGSVSVTGSLTVNGAGTFAGSVTAATLSTIGTAIAGQNVQLNLNGVSGKAQRIEFQNSGVQQWLIGAGAANETNNFEIYNSNGQMALSFAKSTSAATFASTVEAKTESNFTGTSANSRILVTAAGVANTVLGFNNSGTTTTGVTNNTGYVGILQAYPLVFTTDSVERLRISSTGAATFSSSVTATGGLISNGGAIGYGGGELGFGVTTNGATSGIYTLATGSPIIYFDHRATSNTGFFVFRNGTGGANTLLTLSAAGAATFASSVKVNGTPIATSGILSVVTSTSSIGATADLGLLITNDGTNGKMSQIGFGYSESKTGAVIGGIITSGAGSTSSALFFGTRDTTDGATAPTERMRITSGGNVLISSVNIPDTTADAGNLYVYTTNGPAANAGAKIMMGGIYTGATKYGYASISGRNESGTAGTVNGYMTFATHNNTGGHIERMRITSSGRVGIKNSDPQGMLETGIVANNTTQGGHFFSTFQVPLNTWTTVFYAPNNNWAAITEFTWVSSADYNRSGAAYMRWAYNGGAAALGVVYTLFNDSQNSTATFRNSGGEIQILITGGASDYYVQVRIQGSKAA